MYTWHTTVWQAVQTARFKARLPHALLFSGVADCGHESFVFQLAASLLCQSPQPNGVACGQCRSCQVYAAQAHPDFIQITAPDDKQTIGIDLVRQLGRFLGLHCSYSTCRVALFPQADALNIHAANSLLKLLEEPAANTYLILFSHASGQLLPTIRSRCQHFRLALPAPELALDWLKQQETIQSPPALLALAQGKPMKALALDSGETLTQYQLFFQQIQQLTQAKTSISKVSLAWEKHAKCELLDWWLATIQHSLKTHYQVKQQPLNSNPPPDEAFLCYLPLPPESLWALYDRLLNLKAMADHPLNQRLFIENMLALYLQFARSASTKS